MKKVFVSGCYDLLHSGHVEFFRQASQYGDLYVGIGSNQTILGYKHHKTFYPEQERLFMVKSIKYVKDAFINQGDGIMDFIPTVDFVKRALTCFGYAPQTLQTDNGSEFTHTAKTKRVHPLDLFCEKNGITHRTIRPRTPWHNGKVERSHRSDQERFYNYLSFYSFDDLQVQMKRYLYRSNRIPMPVLGWKSPNLRQKELTRVGIL